MPRMCGRRQSGRRVRLRGFGYRAKALECQIEGSAALPAWHVAIGPRHRVRAAEGEGECMMGSGLGRGLRFGFGFGFGFGLVLELGSARGKLGLFAGQMRLG